MGDIPRQGIPQSTVAIVDQGQVPDTIAGITQVFSSGGTVKAKDGSGNITTLGVAGGGSGTVTSVAAAGDGTILSATPSAPVTVSGTLNLTAAPASSNSVLAGPSVSGGATTGSGGPVYRKLVNWDIDGANSTSGQVLTSTGSASSPTWQTLASGGTVSSVSFTGDGTVYQTGPTAAVTTTGTLAPTLVSQTGNTVFASPSGGGAGSPTFRKIIAADLTGTGGTSGQVLTSTGASTAPTWQALPAPGGSGTVTSVALQGDGTLIQTGPSSPVTTSGNLQVSLANATGNTLLASPVGGGSGTPTYRKAINTDLVGTNSSSGQILYSTGAGTSPTWGANYTGTVTSVSFTGDGTVFQSLPGVPVTTSGTLTPSLNLQSGNTVFASPVGGGASFPSFRKLIKDDIVGTGSTSGQVLTSTGAGNSPTWSTPTTGTVTSVAFAGDGALLSSTPSTAVTSSGNVTASLVSQSANQIFAGPSSGGSATPTWRSLVPADMPSGNSGTTWTMNTALASSSGIASAPTYSFTGNTGYGMWYGTSALRFAAAGVERLALSATDAALSVPLGLKGSTSGKITVSAPATVTDHTLIMPAATGTGALTNDGAGNLSWAAASVTGIPTHNISNKTADYTIVTGDAGKLFTDRGSTALVTFTLLSNPTTGFTVAFMTFFSSATARLRIMTSGSDKIMYAASSSSTLTTMVSSAGGRAGGGTHVFLTYMGSNIWAPTGGFFFDWTYS